MQLDTPCCGNVACTYYDILLLQAQYQLQQFTSTIVTKHAESFVNIPNSYFGRFFTKTNAKIYIF